MKESEIKQNWFHIYDEILDNKINKRIVHVSDLYTQNDYLCIKIDKTIYANMSIRARNINCELAYIETKNNDLRISLGPLNRFPSVPSNNCHDYENKIIASEFDILSE
jgi:hypothetical protein